MILKKWEGIICDIDFFSLRDNIPLSLLSNSTFSKQRNNICEAEAKSTTFEQISIEPEKKFVR